MTKIAATSTLTPASISLRAPAAACFHSPVAIPQIFAVMMEADRNIGQPSTGPSGPRPAAAIQYSSTLPNQQIAIARARSQ